MCIRDRNEPTREKPALALKSNKKSVINRGSVQCEFFPVGTRKQYRERGKRKSHQIKTVKLCVKSEESVKHKTVTEGTTQL